MTDGRGVQVEVDYRGMADEGLEAHAAAIRDVQADRLIIATEAEICASMDRQIAEAQAEKQRAQERAAQAREREGIDPSKEK